jgi:hypothetical protein
MAAPDLSHRPGRAMTSTAGSPGLSKSRFTAGLQCEKRLWLQVHARELATPVDAARQAIFDAGSEVGRQAHRLFPGGVLVAEAYDQHDAAVERTRALLADSAVPAIFEAAFTHAGVRVRVDVLERLGGGRFGLREVKSTGSAKPEHEPDVAVQLFVLEGCGLEVASVELVHVDTSYVRGADGIDWPRFFTRADLTALARAALPEVRARVAALHAVLAGAAAPEIAPWRQCTRPYACEFLAHCQRDLPEDWVLALPRISEQAAEELRERGIERIRDIPEDFTLDVLQRRVRDALVSGATWVSQGLARALSATGLPALYLDFETVGPAIPVWPGTRPYQTVPFQWSLHRQERDGTLAHEAFLADAASGADPRRALAESLLAALEAQPALPILTYSGYETRILRELAHELPDLAGRLEALAGRLVDLLPIMRSHVYHPAFGGSFSLKDVAPALVPGFGYDDLGALADGSAAQQAFARLLAGGVGAEDAERTRAALLAYCQRDTLALVELHRALTDLARAPGRNP